MRLSASSSSAHSRYLSNASSSALASFSSRSSWSVIGRRTDGLGPGGIEYFRLPDDGDRGFIRSREGPKIDFCRALPAHADSTPATRPSEPLTTRLGALIAFSRLACVARIACIRSEDLGPSSSVSVMSSEASSFASALILAISICAANG